MTLQFALPWRPAMSLSRERLDIGDRRRNQDRRLRMHMMQSRRDFLAGLSAVGAGVRNIGGRTADGSLTTGYFWTPDLIPELVAWDFRQEDLLEGPVSSWTSRGFRPKTATGTATKLAGGGGIQFNAGTTQNLQWAVEPDAPFLHRCWCVIFKAANGGGGGNGTPVLTVHSSSGGAVYRQPSITADTTAGANSRLFDSDGASPLSGPTQGGNWNIVIGSHRGWSHVARINGVASSRAFKTMQVPNHSIGAWLGAGTSAPGSANLRQTLTLDAALMLHGIPDDAFLALLQGWGHWRVGRADLLPIGHPYKAAPPAPDAYMAPTRLYQYNDTAWTAYKSTPANISNFANTPPTPAPSYSRVFFDDFLTKSVVDDVSGAATAIWYAPGWNTAVPESATNSRVADTPDCYVHDGGALTGGGNGSLSLRLQETAPGSAIWRTGTMYSINLSGKGRWWAKGRFITRIRFTGIPPWDPEVDWPGFFPAWWYYDHHHLFYRTRNRLELDYFEHEGDGVKDTRVAQTFHVHEPKYYLPSLADRVRELHDSAGIATTSATQTDIAHGWPTDTHLYDGEWHVYEMRIEKDYIYTIVDGLELGRRQVSQEILRPKHMILTFSYRQARGTEVPGGVYGMEIDYVEIQQLEADLSVVPTGFSARPTLAGIRGLGNTITCTPNTTGSQIDFRWYANGEPMVGATGATFVETTNSVGKPLRCHVTNWSLLDQPQAWTPRRR
jgi:hypothetical protein